MKKVVAIIMALLMIFAFAGCGSGDLKPGGTKSGTPVFEEPKGDESMILLYYLNVFIDE